MTAPARSTSADRRNLSLGAGIPGALALAFAGAVLAGQRLPAISSDRDAIVALLVLAWLGCTAAVGSTTKALGWRHPACLAGAALGVATLALIGALVAGLAAPDRTVFVVLTALLGAKWAIGRLAWAAHR